MKFGQIAGRLVVLSLLAALLWAMATAGLFAMWLSLAVGALTAAYVVADRAHPWRMTLAGALLAPLVLVQWALPEFAAQLDEISCEVRGAHGQGPCREQDLDRVGPILSSRQHLAVRWLNLHMAAGGWLLGFEEVAWETMMLDRLSTRATRVAVQSQSLRSRAALCREGAAATGPTIEADSDFALDSDYAARVAAKLAKRTRDGQHRWADLRFPGQFGDHPWHVVLALWVPDGRLHATRDGDHVRMQWRGGIQYPPHVIATFPIPRLVGPPTVVTLDEAAFCGLQMDGVWVPYTLTWSWDARPASGDKRRAVEKVARSLDDRGH